MDSFEGKVVVVTGAASGMGLAFARRFAREGAALVLADVDAEPLAMAESELRAAGAGVLARRTDVARAADLEAQAEAAYARFGAVHIVCNNAGGRACR